MRGVSGSLVSYCIIIGVLFLGVSVSTGGSAKAAGADAEVRDFVIAIDGKPAGEYHMTITRQDDGTVSMAAQADSVVRAFGGLYKYTYSYRGTETWKDGQLLRLDSSTDDNGKIYTVQAFPDPNGLRVRVNGEDRISRADVWVTTYWNIPRAQQRNQALPLLDADTGRDIPAKLQYIGTSPLNLCGQVQNYAHWRLSGGVQVDLWYDGTERLVRQEWVEDGHKALLELVKLRH